MPGLTDKPADDGAGAAAGAASGEPQKPTEPKPITFASQEELDRMIQARLARAIPPDYEDLKKKATAYDEAQNEAKSELQREKEARQAAEAQVLQAQASANAVLARSAIMVEAAQQNAVNPEVVVALLAGDTSIAVKDGKVTGVKDAVKELLKNEPYLVKGKTPAASGAEFGGNDDPKDKAAKIAALERTANDPSKSWAERREAGRQARELKLA